MAAPPRADPDRGIFETLLARRGEPVELEAHLARLGASLAALYGERLPADAGERLAAAAAGLDLGRLRLTAVPAAAGVELDVAGAAVDPVLLGAAVELRSIRVPGGLGAHKWIDRSALPAGEDGGVPLLLDDGDEVLEAARANLFLARYGALFTPPADGRILPGTTRAAVLALARAAGIEVAERRLRRRDLLEAEEVLLTGSVRGIEPARALDGESLAAPGPIGGLLGDRLAEAGPAGK